MTVYIVKGNTGEYDDYTEWSVVGFKEELAAMDLCSVLNTKLKDLGIFRDDDNVFDATCKFKKWNPSDKGLEEKEIKELDSKFTLDYTGTEYFIETLEVV